MATPLRNNSGLKHISEYLSAYNNLPVMSDYAGQESTTTRIEQTDQQDPAGGNMASPMSDLIYTCAHCGGIFKKGLTDEEAEAELGDLDRQRSGGGVTERERLKALLVERSLRLGDFTLASGAKSDYYIDARATTMSAEGQMLVGLVGSAVIRESGLTPTHVGGLTMGADPIAYAIAHRSCLDGRPMDGFSVRKRTKEHGTGQRIEGGLPRDAHCLIVEDTMTTGRSSMEAVGALREHGAVILGVLCLVNRSDGAERFYEGQGLPLISVFTGDELLEAKRAAEG